MNQTDLEKEWKKKNDFQSVENGNWRREFIPFSDELIKKINPKGFLTFNLRTLLWSNVFFNENRMKTKEKKIIVPNWDQITQSSRFYHHIQYRNTHTHACTHAQTVTRTQFTIYFMSQKLIANFTIVHCWWENENKNAFKIEK